MLIMYLVMCLFLGNAEWWKQPTGTASGKHKRPGYYVKAATWEHTDSKVKWCTYIKRKKSSDWLSNINFSMVGNNIVKIK